MFDVIGAVEAGTQLVNGVIERVWPNPEEAEKRKLELLKAELEAEYSVIIKQIEVNAKEAEHSSIFVSGGRPMVMWICAFALAYASIFEPLARFIALVFFDYDGEFPVIDSDLTLQVLMGLLGLSGMRSYEKRHGVARKSL